MKYRAVPHSCTPGEDSLANAPIGDTIYGKLAELSDISDAAWEEVMNYLHSYIVFQSRDDR